MIKSKITKEEVNLMPLVIFPGEITIVDELSKVDSAIEELRKNKVVGIDTETKPSFTRGSHNKVSLVQLSNLEHCFLFRLNLIDLPTALANFLADKNILKIGLSLRDDLTGLNKRHSFKPDGFIDIQSIAQSYGILELSLQKIYAILFDKKISKSQRLTNWENIELTDQQQRYAATDAWASLKIYLQLLSEKQISKKELKKILDDNALELKERQALNNAQATAQFNP